MLVLTDASGVLLIITESHCQPIVPKHNYFKMQNNFKMVTSRLAVVVSTCVIHNYDTMRKVHYVLKKLYYYVDVKYHVGNSDKIFSFGMFL